MWCSMRLLVCCLAIGQNIKQLNNNSSRTHQPGRNQKKAHEEVARNPFTVPCWR